MLENDSASLRTDFVAGRNPVTEALRSGRAADSLLVAEGSSVPGNIISLARKRGVTVKEVSPHKLDRLCNGQVHQGVVLMCAAKRYSSLDEVFGLAARRNEPPFILMCDGITDPHNLGALIRSAEACGVHGVIIPERNGAGLTATVAKSSAGALEYMHIVKVKNLASTADELKKREMWLYCADMDGADIRSVDFSGPAAVVVGGEGSGVSRLVKEKCDFTVSIPMRGKINSLNASVAGAIMMYEVSRGRRDV